MESHFKRYLLTFPPPSPNNGFFHFLHYLWRICENFESSIQIKYKYNMNQYSAWCYKYFFVDFTCINVKWYFCILWHTTVVAECFLRQNVVKTKRFGKTIIFVLSSILGAEIIIFYTESWIFYTKSCFLVFFHTSETSEKIQLFVSV